MLVSTRTIYPTLATLALSATAIAQPDPTYAPPPEPVPAPVEEEQDFMTRMGISVAAGVGFDDFTNESIRSATDMGGSWNVRAAIGTRSLVAFEGSYIGSAQSIDALGLDTDAILVGNGLQGALRLNVMLDWEFQPFAYAGVAWRHYDITNADFNQSDISDDDDVLELPMGVGFAYKYRGLVLDARGEFRAATEEDMVPSLSSENAGDPARMHRWGINLNVGYEF